MLKLCFYVPATHLEKVKTACFAAGAGRIGNYDSCAWECLGMGQFRALPGAKPFLGKPLETEKVAEYRVEMILEAKLAKDVIAALKASHPYETPAYDIVRIESF